MESDEEFARMLQAEEDAKLAATLQQEEAQSFAGPSHASSPTLENYQPLRRGPRRDFRSLLDNHLTQVLQYERAGTRAKVQELVWASAPPVSTLEERAAIKAYKATGKDTFDASGEEERDLMLRELLAWFKSWFRWVDSPPCDGCRRGTTPRGYGTPTILDACYLASRVELYGCSSCGKETRFPRYNDPIKILEERRGRCGEWATAFTAICRALGYKVRQVFDWTDHVWTECYSRHLGRWVHLDACEGAFDQPLLYESGWGKQLSYVIAFSVYGVRDVTRRYTADFESRVLPRRQLLSEDALAAEMRQLTTRVRQRLPGPQLEEALLEDTAETEELLRGLSLREPQGEGPLPGRQTGSVEWRRARGELGEASAAEDPPAAAPAPSHPGRQQQRAWDDHVGRIFRLLGALCSGRSRGGQGPSLQEGPSSAQGPWLLPQEAQARLELLRCAAELVVELRLSPYKTRGARVAAQWEESVSDRDLLALLGAAGIALERGAPGGGGQWLRLQERANPVKAAVRLAVMADLVEASRSALAKGPPQKDSWLWWAACSERLSGGIVHADGQNPPQELAICPFDGTSGSKWLSPEGGKRDTWLSYELPDGAQRTLPAYALTSAGDCSERDPKDWVLQGRGGPGGGAWVELDRQQNIRFDGRSSTRVFEIMPSLSSCKCSEYRFLFTSVCDPAAAAALQLAGVDLFVAPTSATSLGSSHSDTLNTTAQVQAEQSECKRGPGGARSTANDGDIAQGLLTSRQPGSDEEDKADKAFRVSSTGHEQVARQQREAVAARIKAVFLVLVSEGLPTNAAAVEALRRVQAECSGSS